MAKTYKDFKNQVLNKAYDVDGYYGAQCWDGYAYYMKYLGYTPANCTTSGYVKDIWTNRKSNGMLTSCHETETMKAGDIAVFKEVAGWTPLSHIAIYDSDAGNGYGWFLGQNQGGANGAFNLIKLPYSATYDTAFRPKCFGSATKNVGGVEVILESGTAKFNVDNVNIRQGSPTGKVVGQYNKGQTVKYWGYYVGNGHRYIVYTGGSGNTNFVATSASESKKDFWCSFI